MVNFAGRDARPRGISSSANPVGTTKTPVRHPGPCRALRPRALRWLDERLERATVRAAQHVTVAYDEIARGLSARQGPGGRTGVSVVPPGLANELMPRGRASLPAKFTIVHPGSHFSQAGRYGECFLRAMDQWIDDEPALAGQVECVVIGKQIGRASCRE